MPEDLTQRVELRATIQIALGNYYVNLLAFLVEQMMNNSTFEVETCHKKTVDFPKLDINWPEIKIFANKYDAV